VRIFVTGGTGFLGSHVVAELVRNGHELRLLARSPEGVVAAVEPFGIEAPEHVIGDITEPDSVREGMAGCDAVLHAAAIYSLDVRKAKQVRVVNVEGTETVLAAAVEQKLDPIVYVSAIGALYPPDGVLTADSPVKGPPGAYYGSKADAELIARRRQEEGAPVVSTYPGARDLRP
jgi:nucleoside-diphosphate-sugar epimerase